MSKRMRVIIASTVMILLSLFVCGFFVGGAFLCDVAFNTQNSIFSSIASNSKLDSPTVQQVDWLKNDSNYTDTYIQSSTDDIRLHAFEILQPTATDNWVIMVHGYRSSPWRVSDYAYNYYLLGYNVLLPALRGSLDTEGHWITFGQYEHLDICDWIDYLVQKNSDCRIILHGVSMGASTVMLTVGENIPQNVRLAIEDSGYTSLTAELSYLVTNFAYIPSFPLLQSVDLMVQQKAGFAIGDVDCIKSLQKATLPIYFIHGDADIFVPYFMHDQLYESYQHTKDKLVIHQSPHIHGSTVAPTEYWTGIKIFIDTYF